MAATEGTIASGISAENELVLNSVRNNKPAVPPKPEFGTLRASKCENGQILEAKMNRKSSVDLIQDSPTMGVKSSAKTNQSPRPHKPPAPPIPSPRVNRQSTCSEKISLTNTEMQMTEICIQKNASESDLLKGETLNTDIDATMDYSKPLIPEPVRPILNKPVRPAPEPIKPPEQFRHPDPVDQTSEMDNVNPIHPLMEPIKYGLVLPICQPSIPVVEAIKTFNETSKPLFDPKMTPIPVSTVAVVEPLVSDKKMDDETRLPTGETWVAKSLDGFWDSTIDVDLESIDIQDSSDRQHSLAPYSFSGTWRKIPDHETKCQLVWRRFCELILAFVTCCIKCMGPV